MRRITIIGAAVALLGAAGGLGYVLAGCNGLTCGGHTSTDTAPQVSPQNPADAVAALGRVAPASEIIKIAAGAPDVLAALSVERGDVVKKGQVLGYLQGYAEQVARHNELDAQLSE